MQESKGDVAPEQDEKEQAVNAAYEYYKNLYLNFYGDSSQPSNTNAPQIPTLNPGNVPSKISGFLTKQDLSTLIAPETTVSYTNNYPVFKMYSLFKLCNPLISYLQSLLYGILFRQCLQ